MAVVHHPSEETIQRSIFTWAPGHEFIPVEETASSGEQGSVPQGLQELLVRLVKAVLINKPLCIYQCLATTLEAELDRRTLWEMQFSQYCRAMPISSIGSFKMALPFLPSMIREVGDTSSKLPRNTAQRSLTSGSNHQEQVLALDYFPNIEKSSLHSEGLKPFLYYESFHGSADAARDEIRDESVSIHQNSSLLAVKDEELKKLQREDATSTRASGAIEPAVGELSKDRSAVDMSTDSGMENTRPIRPRNEFLLRSGHPQTTDEDPDEFQDRQKYLLGDYHDSGLKSHSLPDEISHAEQMKIDTTHRQENTVYKLDTKPADLELSDSGLPGDSSDWPSYIPRGDRLADAMLYFETKATPVQSLELHEDFTVVASTDQFADVYNEAAAGFLQEPDKNCSGPDSYIAPRRRDVAIAASSDHLAQHETTETTFLQGSVHTTRKPDFNVVHSRNDLAAAANTDKTVVQDELQAACLENSSQFQDVPDSYITTETKPSLLELVRALESYECHSSPDPETAETDELEYVTPPNESFKRSREELQEEEEFHTPRATFPDDLVFACNVETSSVSVPVLSDKLLLASPCPVQDEDFTKESMIQEFPHSDESTHSEGLTSDTEVEEFPNNNELIHGKDLKLETVIQEFPHYDESRHGERLMPESVVEEVSHGQESTHDEATSDKSVIQECPHYDESTHGKELRSECVVDAFPHSKESSFDTETSNESQIQEFPQTDESTMGEGSTSGSVEEFPLGKESTPDKEMSDESVIQEFPQSEGSPHDKGLTSESVIQEFLQSNESAHREKSVSEEFEEFQSSGELVNGEAVKSDSAIEDFPKSQESTLSNELIPKSVCGEETRLNSMHAKHTANESTSRNQMTPDSADETVMQPGSSLEEEIAHDRELTSELVFHEEMLYESMLGKVMMHALLTGEEMNPESECGEEMSQDLVIHGKRFQKAMLQQEATYESVFGEEMNPDSENAELKTPDSVYEEEVTLKSLPGEEMIHESKLGEEISSDADQTEMKIPDLVYSTYITHESKLHEETCPDSENPEIKISDSVYNEDNTSESSPYTVKEAEELQGETQQSPASALESVSSDEKDMFVKPVKEPLFYGRNIYLNFSQASESEIPSVASKPTMSEEKTAQMLEWDELNFDGRRLDVIPSEECTSNENLEQEVLFAAKEGRGLIESSLTVSESDTEAGQFSHEITADHLDGFSNYSLGQSLGRQARTRLRWYSISASCNDVLQEEDEEDESNSSRSRSTFEGETIDNSARDSQTIRENDVCGYSEVTLNEITDRNQSQKEQLEVTFGSQESKFTDNSLIRENVDAGACGFGVAEDQMNLLESSGESQFEAEQELNESSSKEHTKNEQEESVMLQLTKSELTDEMVTANDSFGKDVSFERKNVSEPGTDTFTPCANSPVSTLEDAGQGFSKSFEVVEGLSGARIPSEKSESYAAKMVTKISGEDLCSQVSEKESSISDSSNLTETVTEETGLLGTSTVRKTEETEEVSNTVKEHQVVDELQGKNSTWDIGTNGEIQVDEIMASGRHKADENKDEAEETRVLEDIKDATVISELDDKFTTDKTELMEDFNSEAEVIQMMNSERLKAGSFGRMYTVDEGEETKSVDRNDADDALCLVEIETNGKKMRNASFASDTEISKETEGNKYETEETESNKEDLLRMDVAVASFSDEAEETRVTDATADEKEIIQVQADEFQTIGMPEIRRNEAEEAENSTAKALDCAEETDEPELQSILIEPGSYVSVAKSQEKSQANIQPQETTSPFASSSNLEHGSPNQNMLASWEGHLFATKDLPVHSQLVVKDSEEIDTIQEFKKGVDFPVTEVAHLASNTDQGMPADRVYDETSKSEKASVFFSAAQDESNVDNEYPSLDSKPEEESIQEGEGEKIVAVHPTLMQDIGEAKDEHEHIIPQEALIFFAAASLQSLVDKDEPILTDKVAGFSYVEPARDQQGSEIKFLHAHPQLRAKDSEEMDVIREIKDSGEYFLAHPGTRSQWEIPAEEEEIIVPQKVDIYYMPPVDRYHNKNDSGSSDKVDFDEQNNQGLNTNAKSSCEDASAVNDQPLDAPENWPTDVFGWLWDISNGNEEKKLSDPILPSKESSTSKSTGRNEPLEHEETSTEWPPLPEFLTSWEENATTTNCPTLHHSNAVWPLVDDALKSITSPESVGSDIAAEGCNSDKPCSAEVAGVKAVDDNDGVSNLHGVTDVFVSEQCREASERFDTKNSEGLQVFFKAKAVESEDWPPIPDFSIFHDKSDGMESKNAIVHEESESQWAISATSGTTEEQSARDLMIIPENQLMDSSEHWPPLPDFILEELVSESPKSSLNSEPRNFHSASQAELPSSSPNILDTNKPEEFVPVVEEAEILLRTGGKEFGSFTEETIHGTDNDDLATDGKEMMPLTWVKSHTDKDEALSQFLTEDSFDDQTNVVPPDPMGEQLELTVVSRLVSEIVSSAKQSVEELTEELASTNRECLATFESMPAAKQIPPELKESALDLQSDSSVLLNALSGDHPANSDVSATNLLDSDYEEASIYWTQPVMVNPPVADDVSLQSSPDGNAPETAAGSTFNNTGPQNNEPGLEARQFCAVASSAFTDLTKVTGSQGDMKSHHNIQSHIELGITACQSWSDLNVLPCGSSKSLQLIGAPELSSWIMGNDEVKKKYKEEEQVGSRQVAEAESQSVYTEGEAIRKVMKKEDVDSGYEVQATREPLLGCHRVSMDAENNKESRGSIVHNWIPIEEERPFEETGQLSNIVDETIAPVKGVVEPARLASAELKAFMETAPILVAKNCLTVSKSPHADEWGRDSNEMEHKEVPGEHDFGTVLSSTSLSTGQNVSEPKRENTFVQMPDVAESSGCSNWEVDVNSVAPLRKNDTEVPSRELEEAEKDDMALGLIKENMNLPCGFAENELQTKLSSQVETKSDDCVPADQTVDLDKPMRQIDASSVEVHLPSKLTDPTGISPNETGSLVLKNSCNLKELGTEVTASSENWSEIDQFSTEVSGEPSAPKMTYVQELLHFGHVESQQVPVIPNSAGVSGKMTDVQELSLSAHREPQQEMDVLNQISCSLCKTDWAAQSGNPDTAATPLSEQGAWVQMGHTWLFEEETLTNSELSCRRGEPLRAEEETKCLSSLSTTLKATNEIIADDDQAYSPTFEKAETVDQEIKPSVSTGLYASITQLTSSANDKKEATSASASATSLTEEPSHFIYSPHVIETGVSNLGLANSGAVPDQDELIQGEIDADVLGLQGHHFLQNESIPGKEMEDDMFHDSCKPVLDNQCSLGTISEQLNIVKPDGSPAQRPGDSVNMAQDSGHCLTEINLELVGKKAATDVAESDLLFVQEMSFPSEDELSSLSERFMKLCLQSNSSQLGTEAPDNSNPSASSPKKEEDDGQGKYQEVSLVEEDQFLSVGRSDFPKSLSPGLSPITHCSRDVESKEENAEWGSRIMQDISAFKAAGGHRVASEGSQTVDADAKEEMDIPRQHEDLEKACFKNLDKDHDLDLNKDHEKDHKEVQHKNYAKDHGEDQENNHVKDLHTDHDEDQGKKHIKDLDISHDEEQDKSQDEENVADLDANHDEVCKEDHEKDSDKDHDHHTGALQIENKTDSFKDVDKELHLDERSMTEEHDEYVKPIPLHSAESETDLIFSLHEFQTMEYRLGSDVEPPYKGTATPPLTDGKDVTIIPVDVLDQSPQSRGPSVSPAFFIASQHGKFKIASPKERDLKEFEREPQSVTAERNEMKQGDDDGPLSDDNQKTDFRTTASKADDGTFASETYEAIVSNKVEGTSASETDGDTVLFEIDDGTSASKTNEGIFTSKVDGKSASETDDGTYASKTDEGVIASEVDGVTDSKTNDETYSSEADAALVASKVAEDASSDDDGRKVLKNAERTTEPYEGVITPEMYVETADDGTVASEQ